MDEAQVVLGGEDLALFQRARRLPARGAPGADHPEMEKHLRTRAAAERITMLPYGADRITAGDPAVLAKYGLEPRAYAIVVANSPDEFAEHVRKELALWQRVISTAGIRAN